MSEKTHITIAAFVSGNERLAVELAAGYLARALSEAAKTPWVCEARFSPDVETAQKEKDAAMLITSLVPELQESGEPWPEAEQRLRKTYAALCEAGNPVFICTILRHVDDGEEAEETRVQIRRLNLLAADISRETGAYVIDTDRVLANIGARWLKTDYRLAGNAAAEATGHFMALTLVNNAVDAFVPFEVQEAAREILTANRPSVARPEGTRLEVTIKQDLRSMGQGRRKQTVLPVVYTERQVYAGWYMKQVLGGKVSAGEIFQRAVQVVRLHGVRGSVALVTSLLFRQLQRKK